jgi:four helix bundle protein
MDAEQMKRRTKAFALDVMRLIAELPNTPIGWNVSKQLVRAATSVGANYRATRRAKSTPDFIAKLAIVEEEADECCYWLELVIEGGLLPAPRVEPLLREADEITAIIVASGRSARERAQAARAGGNQPASR